MDNTQKYIWSEMITFFERNYYIHNGLTIPFIIGAIKLLNENTVTIRKLIKELADLQNYNRATIMKCNNIDEFVVGVMDFESEEYYKKFPKNILKEFNNITLIDSSLNMLNDTEELISYFENRYKSEIELEQYSRMNGKWSKFSTEDVQHIEHFKNKVIDLT